jgi:hypothetical protein
MSGAISKPLTLRPPRVARPPRPRPRPRPRPEARRRVSLPLVPSPPLPVPSAAASGLRASWMETLRSMMLLPFSSVMARSASDGVDKSTKAYPTGRVVRGLVGMETDSLCAQRQLPFRKSAGPKKICIHQVVLEEFFQLSLSGRVREIPNVKSPPWLELATSEHRSGEARYVVD